MRPRPKAGLFAVVALSVVSVAFIGCSSSAPEKPQTTTTVEAPAEDESLTLASGSFTGMNDHVVSGGVRVTEGPDGTRYVTLAADFSLDGAPDPRLGFGNDGEYDTATTMDLLESHTGEQTYQVPDTVDPTEYNELYVWCEQFSVELAVAPLSE